MLLELTTSLREELLEPLLRAGPGAEDTPHEPTARLLVVIVFVGAHHRHRSVVSLRCRRIDPKPSSSERSAGSTRLRRALDNSCRPHLHRRVKPDGLEADTPSMDAQG